MGVMLDRVVDLIYWLDEDTPGSESRSISEIQDRYGIEFQNAHQVIYQARKFLREIGDDRVLVCQRGWLPRYRVTRLWADAEHPDIRGYVTPGGATMLTMARNYRHATGVARKSVDARSRLGRKLRDLEINLARVEEDTEAVAEELQELID
jgi:hypothetical protein